MCLFLKKVSKNNVNYKFYKKGNRSFYKKEKAIIFTGMEIFENINDFYARQQKDPSFQNKGIPPEYGHFNVFERKYCTSNSGYSRRDFYKVSLIIGEGKLFYADKWILIDRPALLFSNPLIPYAWEAVSEQQEGYYCLFTEDFIQSSERNRSLADSPLFRIGDNKIFFLDEKKIDEIAAIYRKMIEEINSEYIHKYDILRNYLHLIIHEAMKMQVPNNNTFQGSASERISSLFMELLERQFPVDIPEHTLSMRSANDFARQLSVHVNHLNRTVKEITGKTTSEHISERIIKEAYALLTHTDMTVSEIAFRLGFEHPSYFNNFFKKNTGISPGSVRNHKE